MRNLSRLLAGAVSALAALALGGAIAKPTSSDLSVNQTPAGPSSGPNDTIVVSERAKEQIGDRVKPDLRNDRIGGPAFNKDIGGPRSGVTFAESLPKDFRESPGFADFKGQATKPGGNVQKQFQKNQTIQQKGIKQQ